MPGLTVVEASAGTGKTFLLGQILQRKPSGVICVATPTHKASNVMRKKLEEATGDQLAVDVALRVMAPALAAFSAALAAQEIGA